MLMDSYQELAHKTSLSTDIGGDLALYPVLGLAGEAGEVAGKVKKVHRDKKGVYSEEDKKELKKELGDVLWYIAETATQLGISLSDVAATNIEKLFARKEKGTIQGSGDNR